MVQSGHESIRPVDFASRLHPRLPVEVIDRSQLVTRVDPSQFGAPQRLSFPSLLLMNSDVGSHTVDFSEIPAQPGRLIQIRPGQIQTWDTSVDFDATLVLSDPLTTATRPWFPGHSAYCDLDEKGVATAHALVEILRRQQTHFDGDRATARIMTSAFDALVAVFDQAAGVGETRLPEVYVAFRNTVENELTRRHDIVDYARQLGYSARTITRACQQATGLSAKQVLTNRLLLEAQRLLVHSESPAAAISALLGFSEPTNFTKFFVRNTAMTPSDFRRKHR